MKHMLKIFQLFIVAAVVSAAFASQVDKAMQT